ncbi:MAG: zinc-ribbon domain-containing protein [Thermoplasmata archaeon]
MPRANTKQKTPSFSNTSDSIEFFERRKMSKTCSSCGASNPDHVAFCGRCGAPLLGGEGQAEPVSSASQAPKPDSATKPGDAATKQEILESMSQSMTAIAINIRRVFILMLFAVFANVISIMFVLAGLLAPELDFEDVKVWVSIVAGVFLVLGILTILVAVFGKRVSRL